MRKFQELTDPNSCMSKAFLNEMTFVLLARDVAAPAVIREWCRLRCTVYMKNKPDDPQIVEALACADEMERSQAVARQEKLGA